MKKLSLILISLLMVATLLVPAFAEPGDFVTSPTGRPNVTVDSIEADSPECQAEIVITPYGERHTLSDDARALIEQAYADIAGGNASDFLDTLAELAEQLKVDASELAISDLFDIDTTHCPDHDEHGGFTITIKVDDASKLVGILHLNQTQWEVCEIYEIDREKNTVKFHGTEFSPFALVVTTGELPAQSSNLWWIILLIILLIAIIALLIWFFVFKKKKDDADTAAQNAAK